MSRFIPSLFLFAALAGCSTASTEGGQNISLGLSQSALPVHSLLERRFQTVVHQQYDFSCGSAALATLLRFHYARPVTEADTFQGMWAEGDRAAIRRLGFSLLDMKRYLLARQLTADGYRVTMAQIERARLPGIALINTGGYKHFVVLKGVDQDAVMLGDPATGLRRMPKRDFVKAWNGILFVVGNGGPAVTSTFSAPSELALAPGGRTMLQMEPVSQAALALTRPVPGDI